MTHDQHANPAPAQDAPHAGVTATEFLDGPTRRRLRWTASIAGPAVLLLLGSTYGAYFMRFAGQGPGDQGTWGQFGDFVGGTLNSLVGLATLLVLACTVVLQMRQLELTRQQLADAKDEMRAAADDRRRTATYEALRIGIEALASSEDPANHHQLMSALATLRRSPSGNSSHAEAWRIHLLLQLLQLVQSEVPAAEPQIPKPMSAILGESPT